MSSQKLRAFVYFLSIFSNESTQFSNAQEPGFTGVIIWHKPKLHALLFMENHSKIPYICIVWYLLKKVVEWPLFYQPFFQGV